MKNHLIHWVARIAAAKESAKAAGKILGDADLSDAVTATLEAAGMKKVDRGAVNHWLKGRRQPNVSQILALCAALNVSPAEMLSHDDEKVLNFQAREPAPAPWLTLSADAEAIIAEIRQAEPVAQQMALAVAKAALDKSAPHKRRSGKNAK